MKRTGGGKEDDGEEEAAGQEEEEGTALLERVESKIWKNQPNSLPCGAGAFVAEGPLAPLSSPLMVQNDTFGTPFIPPNGAN